jgi:hypothetical protein
MRLFLVLALAPVLFAQSAADDLLKMVGPVPASEPPHVERFSEFALATGGPVPLIGEAAGAGISQWMNSPKEWGQGWGAFGERYGSNLAYNAVRQVFAYGVSVPLREDTRYFASSQSGKWRRTRHALVSTFTARTMDGHDRFSISNTGGVIAAAGVSSIWGPDSWKGPENIAINAGLSFASTAAFNVVREFLPEILGRRRK